MVETVEAKNALRVSRVISIKSRQGFNISRRAFSQLRND
jgi:hypothetical protein